MWWSPKDCALVRQHTRVPYINAKEAVQSPALLFMSLNGWWSECMGMVRIPLKAIKAHQTTPCCHIRLPFLLLLSSFLGTQHNPSTLLFFLSQSFGACSLCSCTAFWNCGTHITCVGTRGRSGCCWSWFVVILAAWFPCLLKSTIQLKIKILQVCSFHTEIAAGKCLSQFIRGLPDHLLLASCKQLALCMYHKLLSYSINNEIKKENRTEPFLCKKKYIDWLPSIFPSL